MDYITVAGSLNYDIIFKQKRLADRGETYSADSVAFAGGGKGANQAVQCAKLGVPTYMAGKIGEDAFGVYLKSELERYGVNTKYLRKSKCNTGIGSVNVLEDGSVFATIAPGANYDYKKEELDEIRAVITGSKILILQMEIPIKIVEYLIDIADQADVFTILNAAPAREISKQALSKVDCLVVNETEASFYMNAVIDDEESARRAAPQLLSKVKGIVIVTLGEKGSLLCSRSETIMIPPVKPEQVIESTGAGDSYIGAYAYGKITGLSDVSACQFAARAASFTIAGIGAQPSMPLISQLKINEIN